MKMNLLRPVLLLAVLAGVGLRTAQLLFFFNASAGFLTDGGIFSAALVILCLLMLFFCMLLSRNSVLLHPHNVRMPAAGTAAALTCLISVLAAMQDLQLLQDQRALFNLLAPIAALLSDLMIGASLGFTAVCHFRGCAPFTGAKFLSLFPILALCARAVFLFATCTPNDTTFVNLVNLTTLFLFMKFFYSYADQFADDRAQLPQRTLLIFGSAAVVLGFASSVPHFICMALQSGCISSANPAHLLLVAGLSLYTLVYILGLQLHDAPRRFRRYRTK